ncbi:MAG: aspartate carbamoyltransferase regulatory subunit [Candidatus Bathyarchaeia archaeon]
MAKIRNGSVVDHITPGHALEVLRILGVTGRGGDVISALMNVASKRYGRKDIVKIENKELKPEEVNKIALIAPHATINIVRDHAVVEKRRVKLPSVVKGIVRCTNPTCITNTNEPIESVFYVENGTPPRLRCHYCDRSMNREEILKQF